MSKKLNKRRLGKAVKRLQNLPKGKNFILYAKNKAKHFFYKAIKSTKVAFPSTVMLELTNLCNLHCTTCPREYNFGKEMNKGVMKLEQAKKIIDEICPYIDSIGLTGMGETLIFKEINEIVDYIQSKNKGIIISFSTNAVLPNFIEIVSPLVNKVATIQISIDGLNEIYEKIRLNSKFEILDKNLRELSNLCKNTSTELMLNMVITKENYFQMPDLVSYSQEVGVKYLNFTLFNLSAVTDISLDYYDFYNSDEFLESLKKMEVTIKENPNVAISQWDYKSQNGFRKCSYPWSHFYISWDGFIVPCCAKPFPKEFNFGNVFEEKFLTILNSEKFRNFRKIWFENKTPNFCQKCNYIELKPIEEIKN